MEVGRSYANNEGNQGNHRTVCSQISLSPREMSYILSILNEMEKR